MQKAGPALARENALVEEASKLYPEMELECEGKRATCLGGHESDIDSINVRVEGGDVILISEWVLERCLGIPNGTTHDKQEDWRLTFTSPSVISYNSQHCVQKIPLLQWCREMCEAQGIDKLRPGSRLLVFWWDMEHKNADKMETCGQTWWPAAYSAKYDKYGIWYSARVLYYDQLEATLHVVYEYNEPHELEVGRLILPLNHTHFGEVPPARGGQAQVFPAPWQPHSKTTRKQTRSNSSSRQNKSASSQAMSQGQSQEQRLITSQQQASQLQQRRQSLKRPLGELLPAAGKDQKHEASISMDIGKHKVQQLSVIITAAADDDNRHHPGSQALLDVAPTQVPIAELLPTGTVSLLPQQQERQDQQQQLLPQQPKSMWPRIALPKTSQPQKDLQSNQQHHHPRQQTTAQQISMTRPIGPALGRPVDAVAAELLLGAAELNAEKRSAKRVKANGDRLNPTAVASSSSGGREGQQQHPAPSGTAVPLGPPPLRHPLPPHGAADRGVESSKRPLGRVVSPPDAGTATTTPAAATDYIGTATAVAGAGRQQVQVQQLPKGLKQEPATPGTQQCLPPKVPKTTAAGASAAVLPGATAAAAAAVTGKSGSSRTTHDKKVTPAAAVRVKTESDAMVAKPSPAVASVHATAGGGGGTTVKVAKAHAGNKAKVKNVCAANIMKSTAVLKDTSNPSITIKTEQHQHQTSHHKNKFEQTARQHGHQKRRRSCNSSPPLAGCAPPPPPPPPPPTTVAQLHNSSAAQAGGVAGAPPVPAAAGPASPAGGRGQDAVGASGGPVGQQQGNATCHQLRVRLGPSGRVRWPRNKPGLPLCRTADLVHLPAAMPLAHPFCEAHVRALAERRNVGTHASVVSTGAPPMPPQPPQLLPPAAPQVISGRGGTAAAAAAAVFGDFDGVEGHLEQQPEVSKAGMMDVNDIPAADAAAGHLATTGIVATGTAAAATARSLVPLEVAREPGMGDVAQPATAGVVAPIVDDVTGAAANPGMAAPSPTAAAMTRGGHKALLAESSLLVAAAATGTTPTKQTFAGCIASLCDTMAHLGSFIDALTLSNHQHQEQVLVNVSSKRQSAGTSRSAAAGGDVQAAATAAATSGNSGAGAPPAAAPAPAVGLDRSSTGSEGNGNTRIILHGGGGGGGGGEDVITEEKEHEVAPPAIQRGPLSPCDRRRSSGGGSDDSDGAFAFIDNRQYTVKQPCAERLAAYEMLFRRAAASELLEVDMARRVMGMGWK